MANSALSVVLVGLPGVGKTTVGRAAARLLNWPFVDFDTEIEHRAHATITEIFAVQGEPHFRELERELTAELKGCSRSVMSAGGGWIVNEEAVALLRSTARIIYLRAAPVTVVARMSRSRGRRPLLEGADPVGKVTVLLAERQHLYEAADHMIDTEVIDRKEVIERVRKYALSLGQESSALAAS
ncbi:MAG TPA: shikimate kinase [Gemmatimonadaceae bacterium]|nr:shikimate kinase [Gemmatimonadaceae bacterium]